MPVATALDRYLKLAGERLSTVVVTGSVALEDFRPGASDVDLVAVVDDPATLADDAWLDSVHARVREAVPALDLETLYLTRSDLARPPLRIGDRPHHLDGRLRRDDQMTTPVIWHSVAEHGRVVHGPGVGATPPWLDDVALREWCRGNLRSYWSGWATRGASSASRDGMLLLTDWGAVWCVLGVLRLAYTVATGSITSKRGAGEWALSGAGAGAGAGVVEDWALVEEALALRAAATTVEPLAPTDRDAAAGRRERVVALMREVIAAA